jgi:hypothetical protein
MFPAMNNEEKGLKVALNSDLLTSSDAAVLTLPSMKEGSNEDNIAINYNIFISSDALKVMIPVRLE